MCGVSSQTSFSTKRPLMLMESSLDQPVNARKAWTSPSKRSGATIRYSSALQTQRKFWRSSIVRAMSIAPRMRPVISTSRSTSARRPAFDVFECEATAGSIRRTSVWKQIETRAANLDVFGNPLPNRNPTTEATTNAEQVTRFKRRATPRMMPYAQT